MKAKWSFKRALATCGIGLLIAAGGSVVSASAASADACGFTPTTTNNLGGGDDGKYEKGSYNNCKDKPVKITVKYFYTQETMCVSVGKSELFAHPHKGALISAKWTGAYC